MNTTTQPVKKHIPNPTGKGGFGEHPEHANPGGWKKENTISYQYHRFMNMDPDEFKAFDKLPNTTKTMAMILAYNRVKESRSSLQDIKEITDRTEGRAAQSIELNSTGEVTHKFEELEDEELDRIIKARQDRLS